MRTLIIESSESGFFLEWSLPEKLDNTLQHMSAEEQVAIESGLRQILEAFLIAFDASAEGARIVEFSENLTLFLQKETPKIIARFRRT